MAVLYIVLPLAFLLAAAAVWAFIQAARQGQFDDLATPALRAILDDDSPPEPRPDPPGHLPVPQR